MKSFLIVGLIALFASPVLAQRQGRVDETKDTLITLLQKKRVELKGEESAPDANLNNNTATDKKGVKTTAPGYRVQIYSGADRSKAYAEQARFKRMFAGMDSYITYDEPNFRVKVGDFTNRREAQELMDALKKSFGSVFLFPETVNVVN